MPAWLVLLVLTVPVLAQSAVSPKQEPSPPGEKAHGQQSEPDWWKTGAITLIGSDLGTSLVGLLLKQKLDRSLEIHRAVLARASHVHERQLDILGRLYRHLYDAQGWFQSMTRAYSMTNEATPEEYAPRMDEAMKAAQEEFVNGRLFIPRGIVEQCDRFFNAVSEGRRDFAFSLHPMIDPVKQTEFWKAAGAVAYQQVPNILEQIGADL